MIVLVAASYNLLVGSHSREVSQCSRGRVMNWAWGSAGAFVYGINALIFVRWAEGATVMRRSRAMAEFLAAVATGAIFAQGFTSVFTKIIAHGFTFDGISLHGDVPELTVALTIGWSSNYLWPRLLRKLGKKVDADALETPKP
jgi:hypothetical protein